MERLEAAADLQAVHQRHRIVDDHDVRPRLQCQLDSLLAVGRLSADDPVRMRLNDCSESRTHDFMIIRNYDALHGVVPMFRPSTCRAISDKKTALACSLSFKGLSDKTRRLAGGCTEGIQSSAVGLHVAHSALALPKEEPT